MKPDAAKFIEHHYLELRRYALLCAWGDQEDADEALYRSIYKSPDPRLDELMPDSEIPGWLYLSIHRDVMDAQRKRLKISKSSGKVRMLVGLPDDLSEKALAEQEVSEEHPIFSAVRGCFGKLSAIQQKIVEERLTKGNDDLTRETAAKLGIGYRVCTNERCRAFKKIRKCLAQKGITSSSISNPSNS